MGRSAGWIALGGGMAGYADGILIPERPFNLIALKQAILRKRAENKRGLIIAVAEGAHPAGHTPKVSFKVAASPQSERFGGISEFLARWCDQEMEEESRHVVLGHLQRAEKPTTTDRFLTLSMGTMVGQLIKASDWGKAVAVRAGKVTAVPIAEFMGEPRLVSAQHPWLEIAKSVGIFI